MNYDFGLEKSRIREDSDKLTISGLASNFDLDRQGDRMARTAFDRALKRYLTTNPILLYSHRYEMPMGKVTRAEVNDEGLYVEAELPKPEPGTEAANVWRLVKAGVVRAFSVGAVFSRRVIGGVKTIIDADLREISIAPVGVVPNALFSVQAGKAFGDAPSLEAVEREVSLLRLRLTAEELRLERGKAEAARARLGLFWLRSGQAV